MRMPWSRKPAPVPIEVQEANALTAAAVALKASQGSIVPKYESWQEEAWNFYDELGEFRFAIEWKSQMISRIRLRAAKIMPNQDEPEIQDQGRAVELVDQLSGSLGSEGDLLASIGTQLNIAGDSYLVGEQRGPDEEKWIVRSASELRLKQRATGGKPAVYEMIDDDLSFSAPVWRDVASNSLIVRIWRPHKRWRYKADAPTRAMRSALTEVSLINRRIQAGYLSRLATAGLFFVPDEIQFPVSPEFQDEPDPFVAEWIETARRAIAEPGSASAVIPIPMRIPSEFIDKFSQMDFTPKDEADLKDKRESALRRLAMEADVPAEILLGLGDVNHWSAWQLEEGAIKTHISSDMETICGGLTIGYLHPRLQAEGEDPADWVVWYDASELTLRPDRSQNAKDARERRVISDAAYRRELGFDEGDAPSEDEFFEMAMHDLAGFVTTGPWALSVLRDDPTLLENLPDYQLVPGVQDAVGREVVDAPVTGPGTAPAPGDDQTAPPTSTDEGGPPDTRDNPPPPPDEGAQAARVIDRAHMLKQARHSHFIEFKREEFTLHHPELCRHNLFTCPVTQASRYLGPRPGTPGTYEVYLSPHGKLVVGQRVYGSLDGFIEGHTRPDRRKSLTNGDGSRPK